MQQKPALDVFFHRQYIPIESNSTNKCIWCGKKGNFNKAHVLSKFLITKNNPHNYLKKSVCATCNSHFGNFEKWLINFSPLLIIRGGNNTLYNKFRAIKEIPIFYRPTEIMEWVVIHMRDTIEILPQLILTSDDKLLNVAYEKDYYKIERIFLAVKGDDFSIDIKPDLAETCMPRILYLEHGIVAIGRDRKQLNILIKKVRARSFEPLENTLSVSDIQRIHNSKLRSYTEILLYLRWSPMIWTIYCAKMAFEFMALAFGSDFVLREEFDTFRAWIFSKKFGTLDDIQTFTMDKSCTMPISKIMINLDISSNIVQLINRKDENEGADVQFNITNDDQSISCFCTISWMPPVEINFCKNILGQPIFEFINYEFKNSDLSYLRLSNPKEKSHLIIIKKLKAESMNFYREYIYRITDIG
jgi:hypothetical protein